MKTQVKHGLMTAVGFALALGGCQQDLSALEKKIDKLDEKVTQLANRPMGGGAGAQQRPSRPEPDRAKTYAVPVAGEPFVGPADAKITIVKGYEYACPFCEKVRPTMEELRKKYGNDIRIVSKQYVVHPQTATAPALAVCAADRQGKFPEMDEQVWEKVFKARKFDADRCWETPDGCSTLVGLAQEIKLNVEKFKGDMKGDCMAAIRKSQAELGNFGVSGTPAFFINGRFLSGAQPVEAFVSIIDQELAKANDAIAKGTPAKDYYNTVVVGRGQKSLSGT